MDVGSRGSDSGNEENKAIKLKTSLTIISYLYVSKYNRGGTDSLLHGIFNY